MTGLMTVPTIAALALAALCAVLAWFAWRKHGALARLADEAADRASTHESEALKAMLAALREPALLPDLRGPDPGSLTPGVLACPPLPRAGRPPGWAPSSTDASSS